MMSTIVWAGEEPFSNYCTPEYGITATGRGALKEGVMKMRILLLNTPLIAFCLHSSLAIADSGPELVYTAGNVFPGKDTKVEMVEETVTFSQFSGRGIRVKADFVFKNSGNQDERISMFFPFCKEYERRDNEKSSCDVSDIRVSINGMKVPYQTKYGYYGYGRSLDIGFVGVFPAGESRQLSVSYRLGECYRSYFKDEDPPFVGFEYFLSSGGNWKGPIGKGTVIVELPYEANEQNIEIFALSHTPVYHRPHARKGKDLTFQREGHRAVLSFTNLEPAAIHDFSIWLQQPSFLKKVRKNELKLKEKNTRIARLELLRNTQLLFNSRGRFRTLFAPLVKQYTPMADESKINSLADAYWEKLKHESDIFIENRDEDWPDAYCQYAQDLIGIINNKEVKTEEARADVFLKCNGSFKTMTRACKKHLQSIKETKFEKLESINSKTCRLYLEIGQKNCPFQSLKYNLPNIERCESAGWSDCEELAKDYASEISPMRHCLPSKKKQRTLFKAHCESKNSNICIKLANLRLRGDGGPRDPRGAREALTTICEPSKIAPYGEESCARLAGLMLDGIGGEKDIRGAYGLMLTTCRLGRAEGCMYLALIDEKQRKRKRQIRKCIERYLTLSPWDKTSCPVFSKSCRAGNSWSCHAAGLVAIRAGKDGDRNILKWGINLLRESCNKGFAISCGELADEYTGYFSGTEENRKALMLYRKGCKLGDEQSCRDAKEFCDKEDAICVSEQDLEVRTGQ